jgi:hypothetical protein
MALSKLLVTDKGAENFFKMLLLRYVEQDEASMLELIINLSREKSLWFS